MAHFIDPRERKFHGTWINEGGREGGREGGIPQNIPRWFIFSLGHETQSTIPTIPNLDPLRFFKCLENLEYAHIPSYQSRI
jgi:hypothetical protein